MPGKKRQNLADRTSQLPQRLHRAVSTGQSGKGIDPENAALLVKAEPGSR